VTDKIVQGIVDKMYGDKEDEPDWKAIATKLYEALRSFTAYDGYGQGGAADANRGDWSGAEKAAWDYERATRE
jgi:hypothetical protein